MKKNVLVFFYMLSALAAGAQTNIAPNLYLNQSQTTFIVTANDAYSNFWNITLDTAYSDYLYSIRSNLENNWVFSADMRYMACNFIHYEAWTQNRPGGNTKKKVYDWVTRVGENPVITGSNRHHDMPEYPEANYTLAITNSGKLITAVPHFKKNKPVSLNGLAIVDAFTGTLEKQVLPESETIWNMEKDGEKINFFVNNTGNQLISVSQSSTNGPIIIYDLATGKPVHSPLMDYYLHIQVSDRYLMARSFYISTKFPGINLVRLSDGKLYTFQIPESLYSQVRRRKDAYTTDSITEIFKGSFYLLNDVLYHLNEERGIVTSFIINEDLGMIQPAATYRLNGIKSVLTTYQQYQWMMAAGPKVIAVPVNRTYAGGEGGNILVFDLNKQLVTRKSKFLEPYHDAPITLNSPNLSPFQKEQLQKKCEDEVAKLHFSFGSVLNFENENTSAEFNFILMSYNCATKKCNILYRSKTDGELMRMDIEPYELERCQLNKRYHMCDACSGAGFVSTSITTDGHWTQWDTYFGYMWTRRFVAASTTTSNNVCKICKGKGYVDR